MGDLARPVQLDPWQRIIEVGWSSGSTVTVVEVTAPEIKFYSLVSVNPDEPFMDFFGGSHVVEEDYKERFVVMVGEVGSVGTVTTEDGLSDVWVWDGFYIGAVGDEPTNGTAVTNGTAAFGYPPNLHFVGQQVKRNQLTPPFGPFELGEVKVYTHPNGSSVSYRSGYVALGHGPQYDQYAQPSGDLDYSNTESWYWYRVTSRPPETAAVLKKAYLVNFRKDFVTLAELRDFASQLGYPLDWNIRGYPPGTSFDVSGGSVSPVGDVAPRYSGSGSLPGGHEGVIRRFTASGFVT